MSILSAAHFRNVALRHVKGFLLAAVLWAAVGTCRAAECRGDVADKAQLLRSEITNAYEAQREKADRSGTRGLDIANVISPTIARGVTFDDAEQILRCAGFEVHPRLGLNAPGARPDRFDVFAESRLLLGGGSFFSRLVLVTLHPRSPDDYGTVERVFAIIQVTYL